MNYAGRSLLSFVSFNLGWWACALGAMNGLDTLGLLSMPLWIGLHLYFSPPASRTGEVAFLAGLAVTGFIIDTIFIYLGIFTIEPPVMFAPSWLVGMWVLLGLTFESMLSMRRNLFMVALLGIASGPLSYLFAQAVHILSYREPRWISVTIHGLFWAALMPLLFQLRDSTLRWGLRRHHRAESGSVPQ